MRRIALIVLFAAGLLGVVLAATGYDLSWWSADGGGGHSAGGGFTLEGSAGQPDAGTLAGGAFVLRGGILEGGAVASGGARVFVPVLVR